MKVNKYRLLVYEGLKQNYLFSIVKKTDETPTIIAHNMRSL